MKKTDLFVFAFSFIVSAPLFATADGPDYWRLNIDETVALYNDSDAAANVLLQVPGKTDGLRNRGCTGLPTFKEWSNMTESEQLSARDNAWCQVEYRQVVGWILQKYLEEGTHPSPSFDCRKASNSIETLVCHEPALMALDNLMHSVFKMSLISAAGLDTGAKKSINLLKASQRGWIKGRDECWKAMDDKQQCVTNSYEHRIAELQAKWMLVDARETVRYTCGSEAHEFYLTFYSTDTLPASALEYGDNRVVMVLSRTASGSRYDGEFGRYVWLKGNKALLLWDQYQDPITCQTIFN